MGQGIPVRCACLSLVSFAGRNSGAGKSPRLAAPSRDAVSRGPPLFARRVAGKCQHHAENRKGRNNKSAEINRFNRHDILPESREDGYRRGQPPKLISINRDWHFLDGSHCLRALTGDVIRRPSEHSACFAFSPQKWKSCSPRCLFGKYINDLLGRWRTERPF